MAWRVYNGVNANLVAIDGLTIDDSKYSVPKNPSTGLYSRLHILNAGVSDIKKSIDVVDLIMGWIEYSF